MATIRNLDGATVRTSRNLRGLIDHARRAVPKAATLAELPGEGGRYCLLVAFGNGDTAESLWADWRVAADWLANRRAWPALAVFGHGGFTARYIARRGEAATVRALLADMVSAASRGALQGNPWRADALRRAAGYLNAPAEWNAGGYLAEISPDELAARLAQYDRATLARDVPALRESGE